MKYFIVALLLGMSNLSLQAKTCSFTHDSTKDSVKWTAYKTKAKVPVAASFKKFKVELKGKKNAKALNTYLKFATVSIDAQSVDSGDKIRDNKIALFFFKSMLPKSEIKAEIVKVHPKKKKIDLKIEMNKVTKTILMDYKFENNLFTMNGVIDVLDFSLSKQLANLGRACSVKHEGKTWSEVAIQFDSSITKNCK
jgi:polyisoprenoid-binding protein YceI